MSKLTKKKLDALRASGKPLAGWTFRVRALSRVPRVEVDMQRPVEMPYGRGVRVIHVPVTAGSLVFDTDVWEHELRPALEAQGATESA